VHIAALESVFNHEGNHFWESKDVVDKNQHLISKAFVFKLVSLLHDIKEKLPQGEDNIFGGNVFYCFSTESFDRIPQYLETQSNWITSELAFLVKDMIDLGYYFILRCL
jgi:hypothetical protein